MYIIVCLDILWKEYHGLSLTISISELDGNSEFSQWTYVMKIVGKMDMDMANIGAILDRVGIVNMVGMIKMVDNVARVDNSHI